MKIFLQAWYKEESKLSMKKHKILLSLVILTTFLGGFLSGIFASSANHKIYTVSHVSPSTLKGSPKKKPIVNSKRKKVLIGYVQDFRNPNTVDYTNLTHVIFSFAHPTTDGQLLLNGETALNHLRTMVKNAHNHQTKAILAIGGWFHIQGGESYAYFKTAISNSESRTRLVQELVNFAAVENLDGIDIDFEHPRTLDDAKNLSIFVKELDALLQKKELSIAVNAKVHSVAGTEIHTVTYEPTMFQYVDTVNIMAYDGHWDGEYNAANLSPYSFNQNIVNYWTTLFDAHNLSREKLVLGVPFYAQPENPEIKQISYATIVKQNPENANMDTVNMNGTTYHYNGTETVQKKAKLALEHGFGGIMLWEAGHDAKGDLSLTSAISEVLNEKGYYANK